MAAEEKRASLSQVGPSVSNPYEEAAAQAVRKWWRNMMKIVALVGIGVGAGSATTVAVVGGSDDPSAATETPPKTPRTPTTDASPPSSCDCAEPAQAALDASELMCRRAVADARKCVDYFAVLAENCELPEDAAPLSQPPAPPLRPDWPK